MSATIYVMNSSRKTKEPEIPGRSDSNKSSKIAILFGILYMGVALAFFFHRVTGGSSVLAAFFEFQFYSIIAAAIVVLVTQTLSVGRNR